MKIKLGLGAMKMSDAAKYSRGDLYDFTNDDSICFSYICTDSREADGETLFVAIRGERVDGHDYIINAMRQGCRCFLCEYVPDSFAGKSAAAIVVEHSVTAFGDIAAGYRGQNMLTSVAVTGSVGKTTTKQMISLALAEERNVYRSEGNHNSLIGMPMSMMEASADQSIAVFEMGMSGFGEISAMSTIAQPSIAVITNIGTSHLEYLKTRENIAKAKLEITDGLREGGLLLLNGDEPLLAGKYSEKYRTMYFSAMGASADYSASNIRCNEKRTVFDMTSAQGTVRDITIPAPGSHLVYSVMYAFAIARELGIGDEAVLAGISKYTPVNMRQTIETFKTFTLISDCYNAAPESMKAAIDVEMQIRRGKRKSRAIAVLGDMLELGADGAALHREVGRYAFEKGISYLVTVGKLGREIANGAIEAGMNPANVFSSTDTENIEACAETLFGHVIKSDVILFKASRGVKAERIIAAFKSKFTL